MQSADAEETHRIVLSLTESAPGSDDISATKIKHSLDYIVNPLTNICQLSVTEGHFPAAIKNLKTIPLHK